MLQSHAGVLYLPVLVADPAVGHWDQALFDKFRAARKGRPRVLGEPPDPAGERRRRLLGEVIRINTPLVKRLVHQVQGGQSDHRARTAMRLVGARDIDWDQALNLGLFACAKACETFDAAKGSFSGYLLKKVFYELQCEVGRMNLVRVERGAKPMGLEYLEDDEQLGRLHLEEEPDPDAPQLAAAEETEEAAGEPLATPIAVPIAPPPSPIALVVPVILPGPDLRLAIDVFIDDHCRFAPSAHVAMCDVTGRYRVVLAEHGEIVVRSVLEVALRAHGVRPQTLRVPWWPTPVRGLIGLALQSRERTD